jgi:hypothetical protein
VCAREKWPGWAWIWIIILQKYFLVYLFLALTHGVVVHSLLFIERVWSKSNLPFLFMNLIQFLLFYIQVPEHVNLKPISSLGFLYIFNSDWFSCKYCLHCAWLFTGTARPFCNRLFRIMGLSYAIDFFIPGSSFHMNGKYFSYDSRIQSFQKFQLSRTRFERQQVKSFCHCQQKRKMKRNFENNYYQIGWSIELLANWSNAP